MSPSATTEAVKISRRLAVNGFSVGSASTLPLVAERHAPPAKGILSDALLERHRFTSSSRTADVLLALLFHVVVLGGPILAGLYFTDTINFKEFTSTFLVAPPPPPPLPPPAAGVVKSPASKHVFMHEGKLMAPTYIPKQVAQIKEAPIEPDAFAGGVPGGVPGGQLGGVVGGVIGGILNTNAKPVISPVTKSNAPVRVGGRVRQPKVLVKVQPDYPVLARQTRLQGEVQLDAILDEHGNVGEVKVISGHPLLCQAALDALKKWKYEPTYLNDKPIAVELIVTITFRLSE